MQRVPAQRQSLGEAGSKAVLHEFEVEALIGTVDFVAGDGMPGPGGMDTDLVHASGFGQDGDEGVAGARFQRFEDGYGWFAAGADGAPGLDSGSRTQPDGLADLDAPLQAAFQDRQVALGNLPQFDLLLEPGSCGFVLREHHDPAGLAIQAGRHVQHFQAPEFTGRTD